MTGWWQRFRPGGRASTGKARSQPRPDAAVPGTPLSGEPDADVVDLQARSPESGLRYGDIAVLGGLMNAGADLSRPRPVLWYVQFRTESLAETFGMDAQGAGYASRVINPGKAGNGGAVTSGLVHQSEASDQRAWTVCCELTGAVVDIGFVLDNDAVLTNLAAPHDGILGGWEAGLRSDEGSPES